jgi:hypothetical protein
MPMWLPEARVPDQVRPLPRLEAPAPASQAKPSARESLKKITREGAPTRERLDEGFDNVPREERGIVIAPSVRVTLPEADLERDLGLTR